MRAPMSKARPASRGGEAMQRVVETMSAISLSSTRISGIVGVIESIAFQTNILALNAAVEAARAASRRGFAGRCASAAKEIRELIGHSAQRVEDGSGLVALAGSAMAGSSRRSSASI